MISSAGKYLVTPIWSWFDLVGSARGECCSPNFVKIIIKNPPFYPFFHFQEIVVSVTRALANCFICLFLKLHSKALTRFIHKTCQELFSSDGRILKVKLSLEGCIFLQPSYSILFSRGRLQIFIECSNHVFLLSVEGCGLCRWYFMAERSTGLEMGLVSDRCSSGYPSSGASFYPSHPTISCHFSS